MVQCITNPPTLRVANISSRTAHPTLCCSTQTIFNITNSGTGPINISRFFAYWVKAPESQKLARLTLNGNTIWNPSDADSPTDIPMESNWVNGANLTIPNDGTGQNLVILFQNTLQASGYELHFVFDIGCQVIATK